MIRSAEIVTIDELCNDSERLGKYVRITGSLEYYDPTSNTAKCSHNQFYVYIDMELADHKSLSPSCQCQFFGEICAPHSKVNDS